MSLKIAILGYIDSNWKVTLINDSKRLGHEIVTIGPDDTHPNFLYQMNDFKLDVPLGNKYDWSWDEIYLKHNLEDFDLVFVLETNMNIYGKKPNEIKDIPVIYIVTDSHRSPDLHILTFKRMHANYLAFGKLYFKRIYEDWIGKDKVFWLPEFADPELFRPIPEIEERYDVIWTGSTGMNSDGTVADLFFGENAWRAIYLKYLEKESKRGIFTFKNYGFTSKKEDYVKVLNKGRIIFHCGGGVSPLQAQAGTRLFEGMSVGKLVLTAYFVDLPYMFKEGEELVSFKPYHHWRHPYTRMFDCEEIKRQIKYYIEHEEERREIGRNARKCIIEKYSVERNINRIKEFVF